MAEDRRCCAFPRFPAIQLRYLDYGGPVPVGGGVGVVLEPLFNPL